MKGNDEKSYLLPIRSPYLFFCSTEPDEQSIILIELLEFKEVVVFASIPKILLLVIVFPDSEYLFFPEVMSDLP